MKKLIKPVITFISIWIILTISQLLFRMPQTKEIARDGDRKIIREYMGQTHSIFDNLIGKMSSALNATLILIALYLFILLILDAVKNRSTEN
ncbi:MAG: hypothetical protein CVV24_01255 [Ignavibacteriae bacterium HGW-Ignavibacteriae-3]|nr:MAG: hypothetical protein CVV24_01255 [Ignavibacteriae bacterium HGW-Ignavibacteriae-3]